MKSMCCTEKITDYQSVQRFIDKLNIFTASLATVTSCHLHFSCKCWFTEVDFSFPFLSFELVKKPWPAHSCYVRTELWGYSALEPPSNYYLCGGYYSSLISFWRHFGLHSLRSHRFMNILEKVCSVPCCNRFFCAWIAKVSDFDVQYLIVGGTELILQIKAWIAAMKLLNQFWREFTDLEGCGISSCEIFLSEMSYLKGKQALSQNYPFLLRNHVRCPEILGLEHLLKI